MAQGKILFCFFAGLIFFQNRLKRSLCVMMFNHLRHRDLDLQDDADAGVGIDDVADDDDDDGGYERNELVAQHVQNIISCKNTFCLVSVFLGDFVQSNFSK